MQPRFSAALFRLGKISNDASHHRHFYTKISVSRANEKGGRWKRAAIIVFIRHIYVSSLHIKCQISNIIVSQNFKINILYTQQSDICLSASSLFSFLFSFPPISLRNRTIGGVRPGREHNGPTVRASMRIDRMKSRLIVYLCGSGGGHVCPYSRLRVEGIAITSFFSSSIVHNDGVVPVLCEKLFRCRERDRIQHWTIERLNYSSPR